MKIKTGTAVRAIANGRLGIVTDDLCVAGMNKGKVGVQLVGMPYSIAMRPDDLEIVSFTTNTGEQS